jgi:hypothetical protein
MLYRQIRLLLELNLESRATRGRGPTQIRYRSAVSDSERSEVKMTLIGNFDIAGRLALRTACR